MRIRFLRLFHRANVILGLVILMGMLASPAHAVAVDVANWDFEDQDLVVDMLDPLVPTATLAAGPGLSGPVYATGNPPSPNWALEYSSWSTSGCGADDYLEFALDMTNVGGIIIRFDERRSATGPASYEIHFSVNGGSFTPLTGGTGTTTTSFGANPMHTHEVVPGSADDLAMRGQANVRFRLYGCSAGGGGGDWRIDNFLFTATTGPTAVHMSAISLGGSASGPPVTILVLAGLLLLITLPVGKRLRR